MALSFTAYAPRRLVSVEVRENNAGNWITVPNCAAVAWRPESSLYSDYAAIATSGNMKLYKPQGTGKVWGRKVSGVLWTSDPEVVEALVATGLMGNVQVDLSNSPGLRFKFNTGLNTNNFRYVTKQMQPVVFGSGYGSSDWVTTLRGADAGVRALIPLPFRLMFNAKYTNFVTTNINAVGLYTEFSNS